MELLTKNKKKIFIALGGIIAGSCLLLFLFGYLSVIFAEARLIGIVGILMRLTEALLLVAIGAAAGMLFIDKSIKNQLKISLIAYLASIGALIALYILSFIFGLIHAYAGAFFSSIGNAVFVPLLLANGFALTSLVKSVLEHNDNKKKLFYGSMKDSEPSGQDTVEK